MGESCHISSLTLAGLGAHSLPREEDCLSWEEESPFTGGHFGHLPPPTGPCLIPRLFVASPVSGLCGKIHKTSKRRKPRQGLCNVQGTRAEQLPGLEGQGPVLMEPAATSHPRREEGKGQGTIQAQGPGEHKPSSVSWQFNPSISFPCKWFHWFLQAVDTTSFTAPTAWVHLVKFSLFWKLKGGESFSSMATFKA